MTQLLLVLTIIYLITVNIYWVILYLTYAKNGKYYNSKVETWEIWFSVVPIFNSLALIAMLILNWPSQWKFKNK